MTAKTPKPSAPNLEQSPPRPESKWITELRSGREKPAIRILENERRSPSNEYSLGAVYMWAGDYQAALAHFEGLLTRVKPSSSPGSFEFAMAGAAAWCLGQDKLAVLHWRKGVKARSAIAGANTTTSLMLYALSVLRPDVFSTEEAEQILAMKLAKRWITGWPDPIAEFIVGLSTREQALEKAIERKNSAYYSKLWLLELFTMLKLASSNNRKRVLQKKLAKHIMVENSKYIQNSNFFYFLRNEIFYVIRHQCSADSDESR